MLRHSCNLPMSNISKQSLVDAFKAQDLAAFTDLVDKLYDQVRSNFKLEQHDKRIKTLEAKIRNLSRENEKLRKSLIEMELDLAESKRQFTRDISELKEQSTRDLHEAKLEAARDLAEVKL